MSPLRKTALVAGALYLVTFVSIPTLVLYGPVRSPNYIVGAGPDSSAIVGGMLEMIVGLAGIGTAVVLYPGQEAERRDRAGFCRLAGA